MKKKAGYITVLFIVQFFLVNWGNSALFAFSQDTTHYRIVFDGPIYIEGKPIKKGDEIKAEVTTKDSLTIVGENVFYSNDSTFIIYLEGNLNGDILKNIDYLEFTYYDSAKHCNSDIIEYTLDSLESTHNAIVIRNFTASNYYLSYSDSVCGKGFLNPETNLPDYYLTSITPDGLSLDKDSISVNLNTSKPGTYEIHINPYSYCLNSPYVQTIVVSEPQKSVELADVLTYCSLDTSELSKLTSQYNVYLPEDDSSNTLSEITKSGTYLFDSTMPPAGCYSKDTVFIDIIEAESPKLPDSLSWCSGDSALIKSIPSQYDVLFQDNKGLLINDIEQIDSSGIHFISTRNSTRCTLSKMVYIDMRRHYLDFSGPADSNLFYCTGDESINELFEQYKIYLSSDIEKQHLLSEIERTDLYRFYPKENAYCYTGEFVHIQLDSLAAYNNLPDTISYCTNDSSVKELTWQYDVFSYDDVHKNNRLTDFVSSGNYIFYSKSKYECISPETAFVKLFEPQGVSIIKEELCEKVILSISPDVEKNSSISWSNGSILDSTKVISSNTNSIEVKEPQTVSVKITDKHGCSSTEEIDVEFHPFIVENLNFDVRKDADCWKDGELSGPICDLNYDWKINTYTLWNTLNNKRIDIKDSKVPEGIYKVEFTYDRNGKDCPHMHEEKIIIEQKCLENNPIFTPNEDGSGDEYFIPADGIVQIYNRHGIIIRELIAPTYWDGKDADGNPVPMGSYIMKMEGRNPIPITIIR